MKHLPFSADGLLAFKKKYGLQNVFFHDWSHGPVHTLKNDEEQVTHSLSLEELGKTVGPGKDGHVFESSYSSFDTEYRIKFEAKLRSLGHMIFGTRSTTTEKVRRRLKVKKSDFNDCRIIRFIVCEGKHHVKILRPYTETDIKFFNKIANLSKAMMELRRKKIPRPLLTGKNKGTMKMESQKTLFGKAVIEIFPKFKSLSQDIQNALGSSSGPSEASFATVTLAAMSASSRNEFEKILGLSEHRHRSIFSSDTWYHNYKHKMKRGISKRDFRRGLRAFYHMIKDLQRKGMILPEMGTLEPSV